MTPRRARSPVACVGALCVLVAGIVGACDINPQPLPPSSLFGGPGGPSGGMGPPDGGEFNNGADSATLTTDAGGDATTSPPTPGMDASSEGGVEDSGDAGSLDATEDAAPDGALAD